MRLQEKLSAFSKEGQAILATNFYNFETLSGVLTAARQKKQPLILQLSESSIQYLGLDIAASLARKALKSYGVEGWLHLDHGSSIEVAHRCLDAGFDSVMIDASEKSFEENVKVTSQVVRIAANYNANVEAELGYVAKLGQVQQLNQYTQPEEAKRFAEATGIHALAIAIGSAHGFYKETPKLQLELLSSIHAATPVALVLHGSSGIPDDQLREAIHCGISKVNLATETKNIFMKTLQKVLRDNEEIDLRKVFPQATDAVVKLINDKLDVVSGQTVVA
ncbi:MAG TPA: class II fructose-bisphosphate aldolase [Cyclobacteriaceae bacterium]|nr:class II fructose-bisphosphate aldolase [Cyclobacteriaceae bacterium]